MNRLLLKNIAGFCLAILIVTNPVRAENIKNGEVQYYLQPKFGYSLFNLKSSYQTTPAFTQDTKAEETSSFEMELGIENLNEWSISPYIKAHQTDWKNGQYIMVGIGVDYLFDSVYGLLPHVGGFIGEGSFANDLLNDRSSGTVYGISAGAKYLLDKRVSIDIQIAHTATDLKTQLVTDQISRDIILESMASVYAGFQIKLF